MSNTVSTNKVKRYPPQNVPSVPPVAVSPTASEGPVFAPPVNNPLDIAKLLDHAGEILKREITNLMMESSGKKLSPASARDLVGYINLLHDLEERAKKKLADMSDEELKALADSQTQVLK